MNDFAHGQTVRIDAPEGYGAQQHGQVGTVVVPAEPEPLHASGWVLVQLPALDAFPAMPYWFPPERVRPVPA